MASHDNEASSNGGGIGAVASSSSSSSSLAAVTQSSGMLCNFIGLFVIFTKFFHVTFNFIIDLNIKLISHTSYRNTTRKYSWWSKYAIIIPRR